MTAEETLAQARHILSSDDELPILNEFVLEWIPFCKYCGLRCELVLMPKAILPVSSCCHFLYGLDVEARPTDNCFNDLP